MSFSGGLLSAVIGLFVLFDGIEGQDNYEPLLTGN
eukprot:CAMPEP_0170555476 /NCGR_PEP_ID=MMETSP0211-20121228/13379_1 /TAXON_ID=311385 /ORGANISM="Pseudokeronopsis sp., Strain OXSARD2" /LENGTH=34 /DNA_ID= /DNA_START= /DNA_END= /DNA_ORIENTATION=